MNAYARLGRYKGALMGIMILVVVFGHLLYYHSGLLDYTLLGPQEWYTVGSVDTFLLLSGYGIYFSLHKNPEPGRFLGRRMQRLLPSFLPVIIVYCFWAHHIGQQTIPQALGNLTTFGWWTQIGGQFNWYIPVQIMLYLLSPLLFAAAERGTKKALWVFPLLFLLDAACTGTSLMIGVSRFPIYFLGMLLGKAACENRAPTKGQKVIYAVLAIGMLAVYPFLVGAGQYVVHDLGFWWHPWLISIPGICFFLTWLMEKGEKFAPTRLLTKGFSALGAHSFEIYLVHLFIYMVFYQHGWRGWPRWILLAFTGVILGCLYGWIVGKMQNVLRVVSGKEEQRS